MRDFIAIAFGLVAIAMGIILGVGLVFSATLML
jgi:uncharacterized protein YjeT (DUF2065 family)